MTAVGDPVGAGGAVERGARRRLGLLGRPPIMVVGVAAAVLTFAPADTVPRSGLDPSWGGGLAMAVDRGLQFGPDVVFTYGPLSFLAHQTVYVGWMAAVSVAFRFVVHVALLSSILWALARFLPRSAAIAVLVPFMAATEFMTIPQEVLATVAVLGLGLVNGSLPPRWARVLVPAMGVVAGVTLLLKANDGIAVLVVGLVAAWAVSGWRLAAAYLATSVASLSSLWLLTGQELGSFPTWVSRSAEVVSAYSAAVTLQPESILGYAAVPVVAALLLLGWYRCSRSLSRRRSLALLGVTAFVSFMLFKNGVRYQYGGYAVMAAVMASALGWRRPQWRAGLVTVGALLTVAGTIYAGRLAGAVDAVTHPAASARHLVSTARNFASPEWRDGVQDHGRQLLRSRYAVEPSTLSAIGDHPVHIDPWEANVAWAYPEIEWRPVPVLQSFTAYSSALDRINAAALTSPSGPDRILRMDPAVSRANRLDVTGGVDGRNPDFESPAYVLAMLCHFVEIHTTERWQVLARVPNRCGPAERLHQVTVAPGQAVSVPEPGDGGSIVVAEVTGLLGPAQRLQATLLKGGEYWMQADGAPSMRLVPDTAANGLLMSAPANLGYTPRFGFGRDIDSFAIEPWRWFRTGPVTVTFVRLPMAAAGA